MNGMRSIVVDKIASVTQACGLSHEVRVAGEIPAEEGVVVAVEVLTNKSTYNTLELTSGRMAKVGKGDVVVGALGHRKALFGYSGHVPQSVQPGDVIQMLNIGGVLGICDSVNPDKGRPFDCRVIGSVLHFPYLGERIGIPARVGYADVRNHLTSRRLYERIKTDIFVWHSYADLNVCGRWVKATPAFDLALCQRVGIKPLEFDGENDSLFHPLDREGRRHMEYLRDRGTFADVPFGTIQEAFSHAYPSLMTGTVLKGDFRSEAVAAVTDEAAPA